jgi:hypothetical protein
MPFKKAPNPILHEVRGFTYTHIKSRFFGFETLFFLISFVPWAAFAAFLAVRDHDKSPGCILLALRPNNI